MCIICLEFNENKLNTYEAYRAMLEMFTSGQINDIHVDEVIRMIEKAKDPEPLEYD